LGLALDESDGTLDHRLTDKGIDIVIDDRIKYYLETGSPLIIDFKESVFGSGFMIQGGSSC